MELSNLPLFSLFSRRMSWLSQRQTILAQNVANSDSPGYAPKDLTQRSFRRMLEPGQPRISLEATSGSHLAPVRPKEEFRSDETKEVYEAAPAGNAVILEEQLMKMTETQGDYRLATNLYRKHVAMLKQAIGYERG